MSESPPADQMWHAASSPQEEYGAPFTIDVECWNPVVRVCAGSTRLQGSSFSALKILQLAGLDVLILLCSISPLVKP
eukprot:4598204-Pyramimonas_sp.AAC.2